MSHFKAHFLSLSDLSTLIPESSVYGNVSYFSGAGDDESLSVGFPSLIVRGDCKCAV